jgi:predicted transcriptional regulator
MYKVYLSFLQMKEYLSQIMEHGLIVYDDRAQIYKITDKGRRFLALYRQMTESISMTKPVL